MRRWEFIALSGAAALAMCLPTLAQQRGKLPRIAFLGNSTAALEANLVGAFRDGLRDLGYVEDRTILIEYRWAEGRYELLPSLVGELVQAKAEVIVTAGTPAALAVTKTAPSVPLVMVAVGDPIGTGLVESLARPGGNATGLTSITPELEGKRLELIRDMVPGVRRLALLWNPANAYQLRNEKEVQAAAAALALPVLSLAVRNVEELDTAFAAILKEDANTMLVLADRVFLHNRDRIAAFAGENRLPMMSAYRELAEAGGLMSFGPSYAVMHKQAARYVDRILKGAKPAELPVEQPAKFEFVLNLKAAQALGLTIPPTLLARADEVIE
jgi:putative tryptophan/tyrosine transport system substrate-binding protein